MNRLKADERSLGELHGSLDTSEKKGFWKTLFAFMGPAYLVSVGYMDPGNWATDIAGGSKFGYQLIWVLLMSNLMALLLQSLSARLGIVRKMDLAQASRASYPKYVNFFLYLLAEIAIAACDLAEVLGMAIGLQLLFGLPLIFGVTITVFDTFILLVLQNYGMRKMEAFIITMVSIIGGAFVIEMFLSKPSLIEIGQGFAPALPGDGALYIAIGIIGATVMPHNLYLHSSLVQTRKFLNDPKSIWAAIRFNIIDSTIALNLAFFVNSAILILAGATFYQAGMHNVEEIQDAHQLLAPMLGTQWASALFAIALIAAGQSSTITGTLAGQIVMEGYLSIRIQPWMRRLMTRVIAIIPAYVVILAFGEDKTGALLILSQVVLSMQLGFAVIPLIYFVSDKKKMGEFVIKPVVKWLAFLIAALIVYLNIRLVYEEIVGWMNAAGDQQWIIWVTVMPFVAISLGVLFYISFKPMLDGFESKKVKSLHKKLPEFQFTSQSVYNKISICLDFSKMDHFALNSALAQGGPHAQYQLIHITESAGALLLGNQIADYEAEWDQKQLQAYSDQLGSQGFQVTASIGFGNPKRQIPKLVKEFDADLLVMGAHGHKMIKDLILGTTVASVRHRLDIPIFIVRDTEEAMKRAAKRISN